MYPPPGNPPRPSPEPEEPRRPGPAERGSGSGTPKLIQRALLRGTALLASLGLGRDLQPPGGPGRERGEPPPTPRAPLPTPSPAEPPPSPLIRFSPEMPDAQASPLSPDAPGSPSPAPLLLELGVPAGQPSAKSPRREEERRGEWPLPGDRGEEGLVGTRRAVQPGPQLSADRPLRAMRMHHRELSSPFSHPWGWGRAGARPGQL